jgi:hypothetical protein
MNALYEESKSRADICRIYDLFGLQLALDGGLVCVEGAPELFAQMLQRYGEFLLEDLSQCLGQANPSTIHPWQKPLLPQSLTETHLISTLIAGKKIEGPVELRNIQRELLEKRWLLMQVMLKQAEAATSSQSTNPYRSEEDCLAADAPVIGFISIWERLASKKLADAIGWKTQTVSNIPFLTARLIEASEQKPGRVGKCIAQVSREMDQYLKSLYHSPSPWSLRLDFFSGLTPRTPKKVNNEGLRPEQMNCETSPRLPQVYRAYRAMELRKVDQCFMELNGMAMRAQAAQRTQKER